MEARKTRSRMKIYVAISFVTILILGIFPPVVSATTIGGNSPPANSITVQQMINITADSRMNYTSLMNLANSSDMIYSNFNQTIEPFLTNNSDKAGIVIAPYLAPFIFNRTTTITSVSLGSFFMLAPQDIMDGTSEIYLRLPLIDITPQTHKIRIRIYAVSDPTDFNMTYSAFGTPVFDHDNLQGLIYDMTDDPKDPNYRWSHFANPYGLPTNYTDGLTDPNWIRQQIQYPNTAPMNTTWFKVCVGLFPSEWYFLSIDYTDPHAGNLKLAVSPCDFGQDEKENSWVYVDGNNYYAHFDLDTSMIVTYGISNGITGLGVRTNRGVSYPINEDSRTSFHMNASIPFGKTLGAESYLNVIVPYLINTSTHPHIIERLYVNISLYSSQDDSVCFIRWVSTVETLLVGTDNLFIESIFLNPPFHTGIYLDHIRMDFSVRGGTGAYARATMIKLWGTRDASTSTSASALNPGFTDIYWVATYYTVGGHPHRNSYLMYERQGFIPYGHYSLSASYYTTTDKAMVTIPITTPKTPLGIYFAIQGYRMKLLFNNILDEIKQYFDTTLDNIWKAITGNLDLIFMLTSPFVWAFFHWVLEPIWGWLSGILNGIFFFFVGIGVWFGQVIDFVIDALEWFSYWCVRFVYSFSLIMVYLVNVYGVISICSGLMAYSRTGKGKDFYRAFKSGWNVCYGIIAFLLALMILAISTLGAVIPL